MIIPTFRQLFSDPAGAGASGPASWDPWAYWDAALDTTIATGVSQWDDQVSAYRLEQATGGDQPGLNASDADWGGDSTTTWDVSDSMTLNTTDVPVASQRWLHDGTTSWNCAIPLNLTGSGTRTLWDTSAAGTGPGIRIRVTPTSVLYYWHGTAGAQLDLINVSATLASGSPVVVQAKYDHTTDTYSGRVDGAAWSDSVVGGTKATGDAGASLTFGGGVYEIPHAFFSQTAPDADRSAEILAYYQSRYGI